MCGGQAKIDTSQRDQMEADAAQARADEEARQGRIRSGTEDIDRIFGGFDDGFFQTYRDRILALQNPELNRQFGDAKDQLTYALARNGTLKSSMAGERAGDLNRRYDAARGEILAGANDAANGLRGRVSNEKSGLVSLLNSTGDATRASNEALARQQILFQKQPGYSPLGEIFAGAASGVGSYLAGKQNQQILDTYYGRSTPARIVE